GEKDEDGRAARLTCDGRELAVIPRAPACRSEEDGRDRRVLPNRVDFVLIPIRSRVRLPEPRHEPTVTQLLLDARDGISVSVVVDQMNVGRLNHVALLARRTGRILRRRSQACGANGVAGSRLCLERARRETHSLEWRPPRSGGVTSRQAGLPAV